MHRELSEGGISLILDSQIDRADGSIICPEDDGEECWEVLLRIDNHLACLLFMIASEAILEEEGFEVGIVLDQRDIGTLRTSSIVDLIVVLAVLVLNIRDELTTGHEPIGGIAREPIGDAHHDMPSTLLILHHLAKTCWEGKQGQDIGQ